MKSFFVLVLSALLVQVLGCSDQTSQSTQKNRRTTSADKATGGLDQFVVYDFWAPWCKPCVAFAPTFEEWSAKYTSNNVTFKKVNVDEDQELSRKFRIDAIPTLIVTANGKEIGRFVGGAQEQQVVDLLQ